MPTAARGSHVLTGGSNRYTTDSERRDRGGQDSILDSCLSYFLLCVFFQYFIQFFHFIIVFY